MAIYGVNGLELANAYDVNGLELNAAYAKDGTLVYAKAQPIIPSVNYENWTQQTGTWCSVSGIGTPQGFDIHNGIIFQMTSNPNGRMATIDSATKTLINSGIVGESGHGNSAVFSTEYYAEGDEYPLLYVPVGEYVNVLRVTTSTSEMVRRYYIPRSVTGYGSGCFIDDANHVLYFISYTENDWYSDQDGANKTVLTKWNLSDVTDLGSGTYAPRLMAKVVRDFILCMQGTHFHDGMLWIASGGTNTEQHIYALHPVTAEILHDIHLNGSTETEGVVFLSNTEMIYSQINGRYYKVTFAELSS